MEGLCAIYYYVQIYCVACGSSLDNGVECNCEQHVIENHVLAYCQTFLHSDNVNIVAKAAASYFSEMDLTEARKLLRTKFIAKLTGLEICKHESRRSTAQRSSSAMCAQDIAEAVYKLINEDTDRPIKFITYDLKKLPILQPFSVIEQSVAERLLMMERKIARMEEHNEDLFKEHDTRIIQVEHSIKSINSDGKLNNGFENQMPALAVRPKQTVTQQPVPSAPGMGESAWQKPLQFRGNGVKGRQLLTAAQLTEDPTDSDTDINQDNWQSTREQRKRDRRKEIVTTKSTRKQNHRIQGTATGTGMKAGPGPNRDIWVCNVDKEVSDEGMKQFIEDGGSSKSGKVTVRLWEPRYKPEWDSKRFRLTIPLCDYDRVFSADFWPEKVWIKKYWVDLKKERELKQADRGAVAGAVAGAVGGAVGGAGPAQDNNVKDTAGDLEKTE